VNEAAIHTKLRAFLQKFLSTYTLGASEDIFATGFVNSLFAMQLVLFVEQTFSMTVEDADLSIDNFRTIDAITRLVQRHTA
jgi:acyl carrier protein